MEDEIGVCPQCGRQFLKRYRRFCSVECQYAYIERMEDGMEFIDKDKRYDE